MTASKARKKTAGKKTGADKKTSRQQTSKEFGTGHSQENDVEREDLAEAQTSVVEDKEESESLEDRITALEQEKDRIHDQLLRVAAEFENYRKRHASDIERITATAAEKLIQDLLPVLDDMQLLVNNSSDDSSMEAILEGADLIYNKLVESLKKNGLELIEAEGKQFNPDLHEALMQQPSGEVEPGIIISVLQAGYTLRGKLLRPSRVIVASEMKPQD